VPVRQGNAALRYLRTNDDRGTGDDEYRDLRFDALHVH
jgi:hypothetical protein